MGASLLLDAFPKMIPNVLMVLTAHEVGHAVNPFLPGSGVRSKIVIAFGDMAYSSGKSFGKLPNVFDGILWISDAPIRFRRRSAATPIGRRILSFGGCAWIG
jgi:hypothetical protein